MSNLKILSAEDESKILAALAVNDLEWDQVLSSRHSLDLYKGDLLVATLQPNPITIVSTGFLYRNQPGSQALWGLLLQQENLPDPLRVSVRALALGLAKMVPAAAPSQEYLTELNFRDYKGKLTLETTVHNKVVKSDRCLSITYPNSAIKTLHERDLGKPFRDSSGRGVAMFVKGVHTPEDILKCRHMMLQVLDAELGVLQKDVTEKMERLTLWREGEISLV